MFMFDNGFDTALSLHSLGAGFEDWVLRMQAKVEKFHQIARDYAEN